ncbi:MAG: hypothetical protein ABI832_13510 [bacterium]
MKARETRIGSCPVFPAGNIWNTPIADLPVDPRSDAYVQSIGATKKLHADFASATENGAPIGIPYVVVPANQKKVKVIFAGFADEPEPFVDESDAGPAPIPPDAPVEGGRNSDGDRHVIVVQEQSCTLFELYKAVPNKDGSWNAVGSVRFDLESNELRRDGWTSADAAGLPIFPGLVRYDEVAAGEITHALRFTAPKTRNTYVWPARHAASDRDDPGLPPMGQRFRLKADFDISGFSSQNQVILRALQTYGMILADNGSAWFLSGAPDPGWNDDEVQGELRQLEGADFEAVDVSGLMENRDSASVGN